MFIYCNYNYYLLQSKSWLLSQSEMILKQISTCDLSSFELRITKSTVLQSFFTRTTYALLELIIRGNLNPEKQCSSLAHLRSVCAFTKISTLLKTIDNSFHRTRNTSSPLTVLKTILYFLLVVQPHAEQTTRTT